MTTVTAEEFKVLANNFTTLNGEFEQFEAKYMLHMPKYRSDYENRLKEFGEYLKRFANLQYQITEAAVADDALGYRTQHIDVINIVMNKIQFLYLLPLSQELSRKYNIFNIKLAIFSILFGTFFPFFQPTIQAFAIDTWKKAFHKVEPKKPTNPNKVADINNSVKQVPIPATQKKAVQAERSKPVLKAGDPPQKKEDIVPKKKE